MSVNVYSYLNLKENKFYLEPKSLSLQAENRYNSQDKMQGFLTVLESNFIDLNYPVLESNFIDLNYPVLERLLSAVGDSKM